MPYAHLSPMERVQIEFLLKQAWSWSAIARKLGRHRTTIRREIQRNRAATGYAAASAQTRYAQRRTACRRRARLDHWPLREFVSERIACNGWTPELVAGRLPREFPQDPRMRVSHETIYRAIYTAGHFLDHLREHLPQALGRVDPEMIRAPLPPESHLRWCRHRWLSYSGPCPRPHWPSDMLRTAARPCQS